MVQWSHHMVYYMVRAHTACTVLQLTTRLHLVRRAKKPKVRSKYSGPNFYLVHAHTACTVLQLTTRLQLVRRGKKPKVRSKYSGPNFNLVHAHTACTVLQLTARLHLVRKEKKPKVRSKYSGPNFYHANYNDCWRGIIKLIIIISVFNQNIVHFRTSQMEVAQPWDQLEEFQGWVSHIPCETDSIPPEFFCSVGLLSFLPH